MLRIKVTTIGVLIVFVINAVGVSPAAASEPEFKVLPSVKTFNSTSGVVTLKPGTVATMFCTAGEAHGEITSMATIGELILKFTGCEIVGRGKECTIKSVGAREGELLTHPLKGILGTSKGATSGVGLLIEPESGGALMLFAESACEIESALEGGIVGEYTPIKVKQATAALAFRSSDGKQAVKEVTVAGTTHSKVLKAFGLLELVEETSDTLEFHGPTEVV